MKLPLAKSELLSELPLKSRCHQDFVYYKFPSTILNRQSLMRMHLKDPNVLTEHLIYLGTMQVRKSFLEKRFSNPSNKADQSSEPRKLLMIPLPNSKHFAEGTNNSNPCCHYQNNL
jgi:hypothetical protein